MTIGGMLALAVMALACAAPGLAADELTTQSLPPHAGSAAPEPEAAPQLLVLGFAGDIGFTGDGDVPSPDGAVKHGAVIPWQRYMGGVAPLLQADANFANLETAVSSRRDLSPIEKSYNFLGDPEALRQTVAAGLTVLTAANNHSADFGAAGIVETLAALARVKSQGLKATAGLGIGADRYQPAVFALKGLKLGIAAIGIGYNHAGTQGPGQPLYASPQDFARVADGLSATGADVRVLSVHYGKELVTLPSARDKARLRSAVDTGRAGIVFGHHSHVPSGVEIRNGGLILYGLGNFMHSGTQDLSRYGVCRDFGLYAKAYLSLRPGHAPILRAVEITPIGGMHLAPEPMPPMEAARRIAILNRLNRDVAEEGTAPVRLETTPQGTGLVCVGEQSGYHDELAARCRSAAGPRQSTPLVDAALPASCGVEPPPPPREATAAASPAPAPKPKLRALPKAASAEKPKAKSLFGLKLFD